MDHTCHIPKHLEKNKCICAEKSSHGRPEAAKLGKACLQDWPSAGICGLCRILPSCLGVWNFGTCQAEALRDQPLGRPMPEALMSVPGDSVSCCRIR